MDILVNRSNPLDNAVFWGQGLKLEEGMYQDAAKKGTTMTQFLETLKSEKDKKESYYQGMTETEIAIERYRLKALGQPIPKLALIECIEKAGIRAFGPKTDYADKFYQYVSVDVLFPEFWSNRVYAGMIADSLVPIFCMGETVIDKLDYYKLYIDDVERERQMSVVGPHVDLPAKNIAVTKQGISLTKYGMALIMSYEDMSKMRLNVLGRALELIGMQIGLDRTDDMLYTLINGDGNSNTPATTTESTATGVIGTKDIIKQATGMPTPYKPNVFAGKKAMLLLYYTALASFNNPMSTFGFMGIDLPKAYEWDRSALTSDYFMSVDSRYAIEHVTNGAVQTESDKIIRRQDNLVTLWTYSQFSIFDKNAVQIFDINH